MEGEKCKFKEREMKRCVNSCDEPICPPSKVICRKCLDKIMKTLEDLAGDQRRHKG